jgi:hypothetical protein
MQELNPTKLMENTQNNTNFNRFEPSFNDANSIEIRLNTDPVKAKIQIYLQGLTERLEKNEKGVYVTRIVQVGKPKVNDEGLQTVMMFVENIFNTPVVQGNFQQDRFDFQMVQLRISLADALWVNMHKYGIDENEYNGIVSFLFMQMKIFLTRTINNGERNSYGQSLQIKDTTSSTMNKKKGALSFLFGG